MVTRVVKPKVAGNAAPGSAASDDSLLPLVQQVGAFATDFALHAARSLQQNVSRTAGGILGLAGDRMSKVDTAWLRMDSPSNLMMIVGFWTLSPRVEYEAVCQRIEERMLKYSRFRQRVVQDAAGASWVEQPDLDICDHVVRETLPRVSRGGEQGALQALVGRLATEPLDPSRPLWKMDFIENYRDENGKEASVLIVRIHHCIADGIALIAVTHSLVDGGHAPPQRTEHPVHRSGLEGAEDWLCARSMRPVKAQPLRCTCCANPPPAWPEPNIWPRSPIRSPVTLQRSR